MMAEVVRIFHTVGPNEAHAIITDLVTREVAVVEEIDGQPVCSKELGVGDGILVSDPGWRPVVEVKDDGAVLLRVRPGHAE